MFTISVTNPRSTPVNVSVPGLGAALATFSWDVECLPALGACMNPPGLVVSASAPDEASFSRFAPLETKRFVADLRIGRDPPLLIMAAGAYVFTGYYDASNAVGDPLFGGAASRPDTVSITP